jgi:thymidine kinase
VAKLYFKYGAMGSSKTAQALITKFNYEERGMTVLLLKPKIDIRDGENTVKSRIGLNAEAVTVSAAAHISDILKSTRCDVIIVDECQFLTPEQVDELRYIVDVDNIPVLCYGLRTDFRTKLFPGSARLFEVSDSISEIKMICSCGSKAIFNARFDSDGNIITEGEQIEIGGNEKYLSMCSKCYRRKAEAAK